MDGGVERYQCNQCEDEAEWQPRPGQMEMDFGEIDHAEVRDAIAKPGV